MKTIFQQTHNLEVIGSNPIWSTMKIKAFAVRIHDNAQETEILNNKGFPTLFYIK